MREKSETMRERERSAGPALIRRSVYELLKERAEICPDALAVSEGDTHWTYADLDRVSDSCARRLHKTGVGNGTSLAVIAHISRDTVALVYGALKLGAVVTLVSASAVEDTLEYMLSCADAELIIVAAPQVRAGIRADRRAYSLDGTICPALPEEDSDEAEYVRTCLGTDIDRSGLGLFTSGTTSRPKGILLTQYRLLNNANSHAAFFEATPADRFVASLPIEHILGVIVTMLTPMMAGAAMCITRDIHTQSILETIQRERCSVICGVPSMFHALVCKEDLQEFDVSSLRFGLTGGAFCSEALFREAEEKMGIILISTLGQTETTGGFTMLDPRETPAQRHASVGVPGFHMEVKIVDGEVCVRGYQVCDGYLKKPEATAELIDPEGWLHTGDLGRFDENGLLYVMGRRKQIIIRSGENISVTQVASTLEEMPGVGECKVVGIPDEHRGEEICACIIRDDPRLTEEDVRAYAGERLEHFKVPRYVLFYQDFPRTEVGKVRPQALREDAIRRICKQVTPGAYTREK